ncbi:MAG: ergothioneine biosynthesis protein EgtB [Thermoleophilaceae bacterium]|nr:ergothioneine biosynthesis protein EgtB [Thermoleophilaceae bacterium]
MESRALRGTDVASEQAEVLAGTRDRTLALIAGLDDADLSRVVDPLLSPLLWDLGHIANFEQRWLLGSEDGELDGVYNPFEHPRAERGELDVLSSDQCFTYMGAVREQVLARIELLDPFLIELVIQHEQQHNETMLQLLRQLDGYSPPPVLAAEYLAPPSGEQHIRLREAASRAYRPMSRNRDMIAFPAGRYRIGCEPNSRTLIYDNELMAHERELAAYEIATRPVTNGDYAEWIEFGGYKKPEWWTAEGWEWLAQQGDDFDAAPLGWKRSDGGWITTDFGAGDPVDLSAPVCHVNWHEASAYARAHGARLPTEFEWEVAASYDPRAGASGERRTYAWGDTPWVPGAANLDQLAFGAHPVGSADHGFAPIDMLGQVWEWTSSEFSAYPGFTPFAYEQYSEPFFDGGYRVLRGGSWATRARTVSNTFRNWDLPERRQIFSGFRLARSSN